MSNVKDRRVSAPQVSGYSEAGASLTRRALKGFIPRSGSPTDDIDKNNGTLRQRSRMLYMATPVAASAVNTNCIKVVGTGLTLKPTIDRELLGLSREEAKAWGRRVEAEWRIWSSKPENCDALGVNDFAGLQDLALKSWLLSGDVFGLTKRYPAKPSNPYTLRLHLIEADRVSTPGNHGGYPMLGVTEGKIPEGKPGAGNKIHDGIEVNANGQIVAYHICNLYPGQVSSEKREWTRVLAFGEKTGLPNVLHITSTDRCDQYRGVPYLAPVIEPLLQLRRYTESELMAALVQSFFTAWIETDANQSGIPINEVGTGDIAGVPGSNPGEGQVSQSQNEYEMAPGTVIHLKPGEKIHFGNPNIPTTGFDIFVKTLCKLMGAGLDLPYDVLVKEFNSSYSASRGALLEAWEAIRRRRSWLVNRLCQPTYEMWLAEAVARGRIKAPGFFEDPLIRSAWCKAVWIGPVQGQLDPKKEAESALTLASKGVKTHEMVTRELGGGDWETNVEQLHHEEKLLEGLSRSNTSAPAVPVDPDGDPAGGSE